MLLSPEPSRLSEPELAAEMHATPGPQPKAPWFDVACAVLMALASLATAWCSYQNSRWSGRTSDLSSQQVELERDTLEKTLESRQFQSAHLQLVMNAIDAQFSGNEKLARFYTERFSGELKPAWEKWIALKPFENPSAPPHPFVPGLYTPRFEQEIRDAQTLAGQVGAQSKLTTHYATSYMSNTVLLATVLFFAGTAGKFEERRVRRPLLVFALAMFAYAAVRMFMLPIA